MVSIVHSSWDLLGSFMLLHFLIWGSLSLQDLVDYDGLIRGWGEPFCSPPHRSADSSAPWQTKKTWNPGKPPCQVLYLSQLSQHLGPPKEGRCNSPKHLILCQRHPQWDSLQVSDASSKSINPPRAKQTSRFPAGGMRTSVVAPHVRTCNAGKFFIKSGRPLSWETGTKISPISALKWIWMKMSENVQHIVHWRFLDGSGWSDFTKSAALAMRWRLGHWSFLHQWPRTRCPCATGEGQGECHGKGCDVVFHTIKLSHTSDIR